MIHIPQCVHKLELLNQMPSGYEGVVFSFEPVEGAKFIDLSQDPFLAIKEAVMDSMGLPCALMSPSICFYTELFCSFYEQIGLFYLEIKNLFLDHTAAFLQKKSLDLGLVSFKQHSCLPVVVIGKGLSLAQDIELLKKWQDRVFIVSAYSALEDLAPHGLVVDLAFASDPLQKKHGATNAGALVMAPKANPDIAQGFDRVGLFPETRCSFSEFLLANIPHPPIYGYTVIDHMLKFLIQSGFESFYLTGVELQEKGGFYASGAPCGYKPDFKKAKEHLESLQAQKERFFSLKELDQTQRFDKPDVIFLPLSASERIELFKKGLEELKNLDFQTLGLYDMVSLEHNPFYQVVIEPLYQKWALTQKSQELDKRLFFAKVMDHYQGV